MLIVGYVPVYPLTYVYIYISTSATHILRKSKIVDVMPALTPLSIAHTLLAPVYLPLPASLEPLHMTISTNTYAGGCSLATV